MGNTKNVNFFIVMTKGRQAFGQVNGLKGTIGKIFLINYICFLGILFLLNGLIYYYLLNPWLTGLFGSTGWQATIGTIILWSVQIVMGALFSMVALIFSFSIMSFWYEYIITLIIRHFRELPVSTFTFGDWVKSLGRSIKIGFREIKFLFLFVLLNFVPIVGSILVFFLGAFLLGRGLLIPYLDVIETPHSSASNIRKSLRGTTFSLGILLMVLAFIPIVGWLLMPVLMVYQIVGLVYSIEDAHIEPRNS